MEEGKPFLGEHSPNSLQPDEIDISTARRRHRFYPTWLILIVATITTTSLISNVLLLLRPAISARQPWVFTSDHDEDVKPFSPADPFTEYEVRSVNVREPEDVYAGPPGSAFDHAWSDLMSPGYLRITPDELRRAGKQSLRIRDPDQESYLAYIEVYHQLHCVKRMVQNRWPDRYPELQDRHAFTDAHFNHCIQVLRKGVMCNGDTTLKPFRFSNGSDSRSFVGVSGVERRCVNWESLHEWARTRATGIDFELYEEGEEGWLGPEL